MRRPAALLIAFVASMAICVQNLPFVGGFVWAAIHGAGASSFLSFLPAALGLGVLWTGYFLMKRVNIPRKTAVFTVYALGVLLLNEMLLPGTPLKAWRNQQAMESVEVRNVRDELLLSARGNPIGVRITFEAVVPRTGPYLISASTLMTAAGETPWPLHFGHMKQHSVEPRPARASEGPYNAFEKGVVYTFTQEMLPNFLEYDEKLHQPCLMNVTTKYVSEADFLSALEKSRDVKLRTAIQVDGEHGARRALAADYVTARGYDLNAMYETIAAEGSKRCAR